MVVCEAPDPISLLALNTNYCCHRFSSGIYSIIFNKNGADSHLLACCTLLEVVVSHPFAQQESNPKNRDQLGSSPIITVSRGVTQIHHTTDKMSVFLFFFFFSYREHTGDELLLNSPLCPGFNQRDVRAGSIASFHVPHFSPLFLRGSIVPCSPRHLAPPTPTPGAMLASGVIGAIW